MASALDEKLNPAVKYGSVVDDQIAQATNRIRVHDVTFGVLTLASFVVVYATMMILFDRYLNLPEWVRQLTLGLFSALCCLTAILLVARPLISKINPLYAAARVEDTLDDPKNSITGYVEARDTGDAHAAVRAAMSAKAAKIVVDADVTQTVNHRSLLAVGGVLITFLLVLGVLFFVFRPTQFQSLINRAFFPFTATPIATRTQITIVKPENPTLTITTGQTITVAVRIGGKVPAKTAPERVRVLLRHNPADPNFEEIGMLEGETNRDWSVKIPEYLVQNGFWYKVAAGDSETPEFNVSVRSLPLFTDFEAHYQYPKYTRKPEDKANDPNVRGVPGTKVTLVAHTNRIVKEGIMKFEAGGLAPVVGQPADGKPDSLVYRFTISQPTRYRLTLTAEDGEQNSDAPPYLVLVDSDQPPRVEITKPVEMESTAPANGQVVVDGTVGDDFGIDKVRLRMRVAGRDLAPVYLNGGRSLRRDRDNTWPTDLSPTGGFKLSSDLTQLHFADGSRWEPKETEVVEYWVEAIDNCTETKPVAGWGDKPQPGNVGSSQPFRKLTLTAPKTTDDEKKQLDQEKVARSKDETQHNNAQQQQLNNEQRDAPKPDAGKENKDGQSQTEGKQQEKGDVGQPENKVDTERSKGADQPNTDNKKDRGGDAASKNGTQNAMDGPKNGSNAADSGGMKQNGTPKGPDSPKKDDPLSKTNQAGKGDQNMESKSQDNTDPKMPPSDGKDPPSKGGAKSQDKTAKNGMNNAGSGDGMNQTPTETAPEPRTPEDKQLDKQLEQAQKELDKMRSEGGDAKPNTTPRPEDRTEPAQPKPLPNGGATQDTQSKNGPKPDPMMGSGESRAGEMKSQGELDSPRDPNPEAKPGPQGEMPNQSKPEPLGGSAGREKESPSLKKDANSTGPKNAQQDPNSGAESKPPTEKHDGTSTVPNDQTNKAGSSKPNIQPDRGLDKKPQAGASQPTEAKPDPAAGTAKPDQTPPTGDTKPMPMGDSTGKQTDPSEEKTAPKNADPRNENDAAAESKPEPAKPAGGTKNDKSVEKGLDKPKPSEQAQGGSGSAAQNKKELGKGESDSPRKIDDKTLQEIKDTAKDLGDPDPEKQRGAREKLDKMVGKDGREAIEKNLKEQKQALDQLKNDLQSMDEATRAAAKKKFEELQKQAKDQAKKQDDEKLANAKDNKKAEAGKNGMNGKGEGKEQSRDLSESERRELQELARDLASDDEQKRKAAEQTFDDMMGKSARDRVQDEIRRRMQPPNVPEPKPADSDPRNKAKAAQLQLEEFERQRNGTVPENLKWSEKEYDEFLSRLRERVRKLEQDADTNDKSARTEHSAPSIAAGGSEKVEDRANVVGPGGVKAGASFAPPGFKEARDKFLEAAKKLDQNK